MIQIKLTTAEANQIVYMIRVRETDGWYTEPKQHFVAREESIYCKIQTQLQQTALKKSAKRKEAT